ncbi:2-hydroxyacylsphingosine 1-beta-galactosyltransferase [Armadillidium vulgare]|nr:2-hydroxyacylsphingosine 1-beta-galactosyltransferase [Armadillidium vulgare]
MVSSFEPSKTTDNIKEVVVQNFTLDYLMTNVHKPKRCSRCSPKLLPFVLNLLCFSATVSSRSFIILSVRTLEYPPRPGMPNVIYAGGAHIKTPKKLPKDLEDWVEGSGEEGFIFFSLGSALNPDFLPEKVLWKWNKETMPDLPSNVKLQKWLPQPDLLGHPKIKLFITHGGLLSTLESSYNGVPVIGIPVIGDQETNMIEVEDEGWGRVMRWKELEENTLRELILDVLNNKKMTEIVKQKSIIMKDRLVPPDEEAAYWVEYVMRHKGAPHIRSPLFMMKWYEVYNIDVWAFIILVTSATLYLLLLIFKFILKMCFGIGKSENSKRKRE